MTTPNHPADPAPDDRTPREPLLGLSLTQMIGGAAAAATGAALASRLGVAGTILGAAAVSLISAVAGAAYTRSLRTTRDRVRQAATAVRPSRDGTAPTAADESAAPPAPRRPPHGDRPSPPPRRLPGLRPGTVLAAAGAVFVLAFGAITGLEVITGESLAGSGRTTLSAVTGDDSTRQEREQPTDPAPAPADTSTAPGPTSTAPADSSPAPSTDASDGATSSSAPTTEPTSAPPTTSVPPPTAEPTPSP